MRNNRFVERLYLHTAFLLCLCIAFSFLTGCMGPEQEGKLTAEGMQLLENGDVDGALSAFAGAEDQNENKTALLRGRGMAYMAKADYASAIDSFENALAAADERMPETKDDIRLYLLSALYREGLYDRVPEVAQEITDSETLPEVQYFLGASCLQQGDTAQARQYFDRAIAISPRDYSLYLQIYETYEDCMMTAVGDEYLQTALLIIPSSSEDNYRVGQIYYYLGRYDDARNVLNGPFEEGYAPAVELMGEVYLSSGDYTHARAVFEDILSRNGENPAVYNGLALCAIREGNYDQALASIEQGLALEEEEGKQQLLFNEIIVYEYKLDFETACNKAEAYCGMYPTDTDASRELEFLRSRVR